MPVKKFRAVTPTQRFKTVNSFEEVTVRKPEKSLVAPLAKSGGRNSQGRMTLRRRGGGHKRRYRLIDFKREKIGVPGKVASIEYDPNRSAFIALIIFAMVKNAIYFHLRDSRSVLLLWLAQKLQSRWVTPCLCPGFLLGPQCIMSS